MLRLSLTAIFWFSVAAVSAAFTLHHGTTGGLVTFPVQLFDPSGTVALYDPTGTVPLTSK